MKKAVVDNKKGLIHFRFSEGKMHRRDLVIYHFLSSTTENMSLWLCFKIVIDHKKLLMRKSQQQGRIQVSS